jgi:hypothetical protein
MVVPKSKFFSKLPISKWSFVNLGLFKSLELTKYIIYSHRIETLILQRLGCDIPSSTKVHTWCHVDDNVLMSPSSALCSHHPCFVQKTFSISTFFFPSFHNPTYTHSDVIFPIAPQSYIHPALSCICIFTLLHFLAIYLIFTSSHCCCDLL